MDCYAGIDIGTTNCKAFIYWQDGKVADVSSFHTPYIYKDGFRFFDLKAIEAFADETEKKAKSLGRLKGFGFSSIGESTVPVSSSGVALDNPPLWDEVEITANAEEREIISKYNSFRNIGISQNGLLGLDKILYLKRRYPDSWGSARYYLPLTGYMVFRKTGEPLWDYSQALRSNAFLVHERRWNEELLRKFGLQGFGSILPMGSSAGERDGVAYGLGGHDHITGLFGVYALSGLKDKPFFYESMGTSAVLAMVMPHAESDYPALKTYDPPEGSFIPGFAKDSFILTRSFRRFGLLNSMWMKLSGTESNREGYSKINKEMMEREYKGLSFLAECDSDFIRGNTRDGVLNYYHFNPEADVVDHLQSTYLYLSVGASELEKTLRGVCGFIDDATYFAGGAVTRDPLFMEFRATAVNHPIYALGNSEISALGAVAVAISAAEDSDALSALSEEFRSSMKRIDPSDRLRPRVEDAKSRYSELKEKLKGRVL